jgi:hypothetical protein
MHFLQGNEAFKSGDYASAIGAYTSAMMADPKDVTFPLNRAAAYLKLSKCVRSSILPSPGSSNNGQTGKSLNSQRLDIRFILTFSFLRLYSGSKMLSVIAPECYRLMQRTSKPSSDVGRHGPVWGTIKQLSLVSGGSV